MHDTKHILKINTFILKNKTTLWSKTKAKIVRPFVHTETIAGCFVSLRITIDFNRVFIMHCILDNENIYFFFAYIFVLNSCNGFSAIIISVPSLLKQYLIVRGFSDTICFSASHSPTNSSNLCVSILLFKLCNASLIPENVFSHCEIRVRIWTFHFLPIRVNNLYVGQPVDQAPVLHKCHMTTLYTKSYKLQHQVYFINQLIL